MSHSLIRILFACGLILFGSGCAIDDKGAEMSDSETTQITEELIAMESAALERWCKGDPDGFLEIIAADYTYFDPFKNARIDDFENIKTLYDSLRSQVANNRPELINPRVQVCGDMAVLTFNFRSLTDREDGTVAEGWRWHTTEVFRRTEGEWKLISTHWSLTNAQIRELCRQGVFSDQSAEG